jgi:predicted dehydrogenase
VEYNQGWLAQDIAGTNKQAEWRGDPARSGGAGAIADIGSHAENLVSTVTGLRIESLCADLSAFVPGRAVDDDASVLLRFEGGARGVLCASQICAGLENGLRLRVSGTRGTLEWAQEQPSVLHFFPADGPRQMLTRGSAGLCEAARDASRLPAGHPEGFIEAFANLYTGVAQAIRGAGGDYPTVEDGARGVHFIEAVLASARAGARWTAM